MSTGNTDTNTIPSVISVKLSRTTGMLPKRTPAPMQTPTQRIAPATL